MINRLLFEEHAWILNQQSMKMLGTHSSKGKWTLKIFKICGMDAEGRERESQVISGCMEGPSCKFPYFATLEEVVVRS